MRGGAADDGHGGGCWRVGSGGSGRCSRGCKANGAGIATDPTLTGRGLRTLLRLATSLFEALGLQCPVLRITCLATGSVPDCLTGARTGIRFLPVQRSVGVTCDLPASRGTRQVPMLCVPYGLRSATSSAGRSPEFATDPQPELPAIAVGYRKSVNGPLALCRSLPHAFLEICADNIRYLG